MKLRTPVALTILAIVLAIVLVGAVPSSASSGRTSTSNTAEPSFGAPLTHQMQTLVRAIKHDSTTLGATVFFPEAAYLQMKTGAIPNPTGDYVTRLAYFFGLDLAAYRQRLFAGSRTSFVGVAVDPRLAQWIVPGACENKIGYWHEPRIRLLFRRNGVIVSVAVASLISWHGAWYVVHLGPNPRPVDVGTVDDFEVGRGRPGPGGGC